MADTISGKTDRTNGDDALRILLAQHDELVKEKHLRMDLRIRLLAFNLTVAGGLMAFALRSEPQEGTVLLTIPIASALFGLLIAAQTDGVLDIGRWMKRTLKPALWQMAGGQVCLWDMDEKQAIRGSGDCSRGGGGAAPVRVFDIFHSAVLAAVVLPAAGALFLFFAAGRSRIGVAEHVLLIVGVLLQAYFARVFVCAVWRHGKEV